MGFFLITLFGGVFGIHKFVQKKYRMGFLYFFTCGLLGIGWIIDTFIAFINIFRDSSPTVPPHNRSRYNDSSMFRKQQIIDDCRELISSTNNADVFFPRYKLLLETLAEVGDQISYNSYLSSKQRYTQSFIYRCYNAALIRADSMKTKKGKYNQFLKAYESIEKYRSELSEEDSVFLEQKFASQLYSEN